MSIRSLIVAAAVAVGTFGIADRADAQWRWSYSYPTYSYTYPTYYYSPGVTYSSYSYPTYYDSGVVVAGYTPSYYSYSSPYYSTAYRSSYYTPYYGGYSNVYSNPYGVSVGTQGGMIYGRRAWRW